MDKSIRKENVHTVSIKNIQLTFYQKGNNFEICDAIKQNESELKKNKTQFSFAVYASTTELYHHTENPIKIKHTVSEI